MRSFSFSRRRASKRLRQPDPWRSRSRWRRTWQNSLRSWNATTDFARMPRGIPSDEVRPATPDRPRRTLAANTLLFAGRLPGDGADSGASGLRFAVGKRPLCTPELRAPTVRYIAQLLRGLDDP